MVNLDNIKKVCVVGWGITGRSLCELLLSLKKEVIVTELKDRKSFNSSIINRFISYGVIFDFGGHSNNIIKDAGLIVVSPGVNLNNSNILEIANTNNIQCVGEIEFASWLTPAKFIAITGTNGKTTTTFITYQAIKQRVDRVFLGGNIGISLSSFVDKTKEGDIIILEVSSFQLETIIDFKPYIASLLNFNCDHLDRYSQLDQYLEAKMNIFRNQTKDDWAVLNKISPVSFDIESRVNAGKVYFSDEFNNENFSCAFRIAEILGVSKDDCRSVFSKFKGLPHRMQFVREINGIKFINDSKATNPSSTVWALKNIDQPIVLIAGGRDKGLDYSETKKFLSKVRKINLFGEASQRIKDSLGKSVDIDAFTSLREAVFNSFQYARGGDVVLFSPMCSSFDMFSNYKERGGRFVEIVNALGK
ncbi:MAG: Mur ligase family protein [Candidatus Omnitrophota bacterium]